MHLTPMLHAQRIHTCTRECSYDVGGRASLQLTCYPGGGARYVRHRDASPASAPGRVATGILYLNAGAPWEPRAHGGQLAVYCARRCVAGGGGNGGGGSNDGGGESGPAGAAAAAAAAAGGGGGSGDSGGGGSRESDESSAALGVDAGEPALVVAPRGGRLVAFEAALEHEVLPAWRERYALTVWLYRRGDDGDCRDGSGGDGNSGSQAEPVAAAASQSSERRAAAGAASVVPRAPVDAAAAAGRIFVSIAAYRDAEAAWTLRDLFLKASRPGRVSAGVHWQVRGL